MKYEERAKLAKNPMGTRLLETMVRKKTNLSVAADYKSASEVLELADQIGPHICCLKTHVDQYDTWNDELAAKLQEIAKKHGSFLPGLLLPLRSLHSLMMMMLVAVIRMMLMMMTITMVMMMTRMMIVIVMMMMMRRKMMMVMGVMMRRRKMVMMRMRMTLF